MRFRSRERRPWNIPQSTSTLARFVITWYADPVTSPVAPWNWIFIRVGSLRGIASSVRVAPRAHPLDDARHVVRHRRLERDALAARRMHERESVRVQRLARDR